MRWLHPAFSTHHPMAPVLALLHVLMLALHDRSGAPGRTCQTATRSSAAWRMPSSERQQLCSLGNPGGELRTLQSSTSEHCWTQLSATEVSDRIILGLFHSDVLQAPRLQSV